MKKLLALVLTLTMVLGTFTFVAAAPEDVVGTDCEDAVARLMALDIIAGFPDGTYKPDEPVTRAQFAKIIVSALGVGEAANYAAGATKFADVPADHWATGYINVAVDMGVIAGYPDGTFKPENQVTFAEAIKMIVAGLGYTPKAEALGGYPGGYLAVAAEEGITEDVTVVSTLSANRGAVAIMVDNALEVNLMEQVSYGDKPSWEVSTWKTLLNTKLDVEEVKGVVTDISKTTKLKENEFKLDAEGTANDGTYELAIDVNTESLFLKEVKVLHKDKEVVWVSIETAEDDIVLDTVVVDGDNDDTTVELKVADDVFEWIDKDIEDAVIYVNYDKYTGADAADLEGYYGYFIFDGKEIIAANLFDFSDKGFVTNVEEDEIEYIDLFDAEEQVLVLDDYDEIYVYNKDFTAAALDDIDENTVMFYWEGDDDELFVMIVNEAVEGEVTRLRDDRVTIDGTNYVRAKDESVISVNEGKDFEVLADVTDYDIIDEEVALYLDLNGEIAALVTAAEATTETQYGILTWYYSGRNASIAVFTSAGEEVEYFFEDSVDEAKVKDYDFDEDGVWAIKYKLNSDGEIAEGSLEVLKEADDEVVLVKDADRKYVVDDDTDDIYFISSSTVLMKALDDDELDPELVDYENLVDMEVTANGEALVFGDPNKNAKMIVFTNTDFEGAKDDVYFGVVTDRPEKVGSSWFAKIDVFGEGKDEYKLSASDQVAKGDLVAFKLDGSDKVKLVTDTAVVEVVTGSVYDRDGSYITLVGGSMDGETVRVASGAVLYKVDEAGKLDGTIKLTRINDGDDVEFLYDVKEKEVVAIIVDQY